jgi:hypothetical protein
VISVGRSCLPSLVGSEDVVRSEDHNAGKMLHNVIEREKLGNHSVAAA